MKHIIAAFNSFSIKVLVAERSGHLLQDHQQASPSRAPCGPCCALRNAMSPMPRMGGASAASRFDSDEWHATRRDTESGPILSYTQRTGPHNKILGVRRHGAWRAFGGDVPRTDGDECGAAPRRGAICSATRAISARPGLGRYGKEKGKCENG